MVHALLMRPIGRSRNVVRMLAATLVPEHCISGHCGKLCRWSHLISSAKGQRNCRPTLQAVSYYLICQVLVVPSSAICRLERKIETAATAEESSGRYHPCLLMLSDCAPRRGLSSSDETGRARSAGTWPLPSSI